MNSRIGPRLTVGARILTTSNGSYKYGKEKLEHELVVLNWDWKYHYKLLAFKIGRLIDTWMDG